ncbi:MAG: hypothetical protein QOD05_2348, partial [Microbacteriaceae bacterium]|nr:hypothetical protein [Microbacteriaceae bacterium]
MTIDGAQELLGDLIRIESTSGSKSEAEVVNFVSSWFAGWPTSIVVRSSQGPDALAVLPAGRFRDARAASGNGTQEPCLVFACHADVVPVSDPSAWSSPP